MSSGAVPGSAAGLPQGFDFVQLLGSGGSGWVALARQVELDRFVAVKRLFGAGRDRRLVDALRTEGRALAALRHPCVVRVYDLVVIGDDAALVMEYIRGADLRTLVESQTLSGAELVGILLDVASALTHAHAAGIVHCDVKPANVLVGETRRGKLADFGIARLGPAHSGVSQGTPRYMAPEQRTGNAPLTVAADSYAFALLVQETLLCSDLRGLTPPSAAGLVRPLPRKLARLLSAAQSATPEARPSVRRIGECLAGLPVSTWEAVASLPAAPAARAVDAGTLATAAAPEAAETAGVAPRLARPRSPEPAPPTAWVRHRRRWGRPAAWAVGAVAGAAATLLVLLVAAHR